MLAKIININYLNYNYPINLVWHEEISHASETIKSDGGKKEIIHDKRGGSSCWLYYEGNILEGS